MTKYLFTLQVKKGDRIAQLILERIMTPDVVIEEKLNETKRGEEGFGSTGANQSQVFWKT